MIIIVFIVTAVELLIHDNKKEWRISNSGVQDDILSTVSTPYSRIIDSFQKKMSEWSCIHSSCYTSWEDLWADWVNRLGGLGCPPAAVTQGKVKKPLGKEQNFMFFPFSRKGKGDTEGEESKVACFALLSHTKQGEKALGKREQHPMFSPFVSCTRG